MRTFFLDLASHQGLIACCDASSVRASRAVDRRVADHELLPIVEEVLQEAGWAWTDLKRVACVVGPGGFMSLRVAAALCNAIAWERKLPLAGIHLSDLYAARVDARDFLWIHSTKKEEVFARGFGELASLWPHPSHERLDGVLTRLAVPTPNPQPPTPIAGELLPEHRAFLEAADGIFPPLRPLTDILPTFLETREYGDTPLQPWYGREG